MVLNLPPVFCSLSALTTVQENQIALEMSQAECRETLHKLLPNVPLPDEQVWILVFFFLRTCYKFKAQLAYVLLFTSALH